MAKIRVAVIGIGNCCSGLVQGVEFYRGKVAKQAPGASHFELGGYELSDIDFVAAFDISQEKIGKDLTEAIHTEPNNFEKIIEVPSAGVVVKEGFNADVEIASRDTDKLSEKSEFYDVLSDVKTDVVVNLIQTGAEKSSVYYAHQALLANSAFINATPARVACDARLAELFERKRLPLVGDDIMSQAGGTVLHRGIVEFLADRGVTVENSYQLDVGGGAETYRTLEPASRALKRQIKTQAIKSSLGQEAEIVAGTSDFIDFLKNSRASYYWLSGKYFMDTRLEIDLHLRTIDAPNSASVLIDCIRAAQIAKDRGVGGALLSICRYGFKRPPDPSTETRSLREAHEAFLDFVAGKRQN
ncbi:MAG: inositol-3-phosphate synthase [Candidatus Bathyarchaeia archaeon]